MEWKKAYARCFQDRELSATRKAALHRLILEEHLEPRDPLATSPFGPRSARVALGSAAAGHRSVLGRIHRSGVGYVAAAAACFVVYASTGWRDEGADPRGMVDSSILRYASVLPADFDLEGDPAALPSVVSEVTGGGAGEEPYELRLPDDLRSGYVPREGRFFPVAGGKLGVAVRMRPQRVGAGKSKTLYMMPEQQDVQDFMPRNTMARFVNAPSVPTSDGRGSSWRSGDLQYVLMEE